MITAEMYFLGGCVAGVVGTLTTQVLRRKIKSSRKDAGVCRLLTMETVTFRVSDYLKSHSDTDEVAVVLYGRDNLPPAVASVVQSKMPADVQHVVLLCAVKNNENQKVINVFMANELEVSLKSALADGTFKIGR